MRLGIFTKHIERDSFEEVLDAVAAHGFAAVQLNLESVVGDAAPIDGLSAEQCAAVRDGLASRGIELAAVSGLLRGGVPGAAPTETPTTAQL